MLLRKSATFTGDVESAQDLASDPLSFIRVTAADAAWAIRSDLVAHPRVDI